MRAKNARRPRRAWWKQIREWKEEHPYDSPHVDSEIKPQHLMDEIDRLSGGQAIVTPTWASTRCGPRS
jgi:acetolactate synthase-1/2/3 large subunit